MQKTILVLAFLLCITLLIVGCCYTDVPVSLSKKLPDERLVAYWQNEKNAYKIEKTKNGSCVISSYEYVPATKTYKPDEAAQPLYFTSITDNEGTEQFLSYGKGNRYVTIKYSFSSDNEITVYPLSEDYFEGVFKMEGDVVLFKTTAKLQDFLKSKMREDAIYDASIDYNKAVASK